MVALHLLAGERVPRPHHGMVNFCRVWGELAEMMGRSGPTPEKARPRFPGQTPVCSLESRALGMGQGATLLSAGLLGTPPAHSLSGLACVARKQLKKEETRPWASSVPCRRLLRGPTDLLARWTGRLAVFVSGAPGPRQCVGHLLSADRGVKLFSSLGKAGASPGRVWALSRSRW